MRTVYSGAITLLFTVLLLSPSFAQSNLGFQGIGAKLGYVMPEGDTENTIAFGLVSDLGTITPLIHLSASLDYWSKSYDVGHWKTSFRQICIGGTASYFFPVKGEIKPYAGAGLGFSFWKTEADWEGPSDPYTEYIETSISETDIGLHFVGGAEKKLSPNLTGFGELKYHIDGADYFGIFAGVTYLLGK